MHIHFSPLTSPASFALTPAPPHLSLLGTSRIRLTLGNTGTEATLKIVRRGVSEIQDVVLVRPAPPATPATPAGESSEGGAAAAAGVQDSGAAVQREGSRDSAASDVSLSSSVAADVSEIGDDVGESGRPCGIGLTFCQKPEKDGVKVKRVKEGGAAAQQGGVSAGDVVCSIDGVQMAGLEQVGQARLMLGAEGSVAVLEVHGERLSHILTINVASVRHDAKDGVTSD